MLVFRHRVRINPIPEVWLRAHVDGQMFDLHVNRSHMRVEVSISPAPGVSIPVSPLPPPRVVRAVRQDTAAAEHPAVARELACWRDTAY